jgi:methanogenic corrinoid protein MtbC1
VCLPHRTESGYRIYSERDLAIIRWLKQQVDAGMAISQAVSWLDTLVKRSGGLEQVALPGIHTEQPESYASLVRERATGFDTNQMVNELVNKLLRFDEPGASQILTEAFSLYSLEHVGEHVITPALFEIGERWHRGEASVTQEHFATNILLLRLSVALHGASSSLRGPRVWVVCSPAEQHEIGAMLLAIYLRRAGYRVDYLGKDIPIDDLIGEVLREQPALILLSATTSKTVAHLGQLTAALIQLEPYRPIIGFGGQAFRAHPELYCNIAGIYMGDSAMEAIEKADELLLQQKRHH